VEALLDLRWPTISPTWAGRTWSWWRDLYGRLEEETGLSTGFEPIGFIELAADADRVEEYRRVAAFNRLLGNDVEEISPDEIKKFFPLASVNPVDATMALAKGARLKGVKIFEGVSVTGVTTKNGRATGVATTQGTIEAEFVVNCAGMWARQLGALNGVSIPNQSTEHYYLITEPFEGMTRDLPIIEDPSCHGYYREDRSAPRGWWMACPTISRSARSRPTGTA